MEKNSVKNRRGSGLTGMILVLALAGLWTSGGCARSESAVRNEDSFREALRLFDEAQSEQTDTEQGKARASELFRKSAAVYEGLIQNGVVNGPILYNQGNAWWRAGEPAKALACWREAQRYSPRDPYLAANLAVLGVDSRPAKRTHWENILFWQNWLSSPAKFSWSFDLAVLSAVTFLMWLFLPAGARTEEKDRFPLKRMCGKASLVLAVLFAVMTISAFYDWNRFDRYGHGIVAAHETVARKGNSLSYEPAFSEPLPQLSEVTVLSHEGDWLRVRADDGQDCWLPAADVVVF